MGKLKHMLQGSSIVETIVASLIFLIVFVISLSTVTDFTLRQDEGYVLIEAEYQMKNCLKLYGDGTWSEQTYTDEFEWGIIITKIAPYGEYERIHQLTIRAKLHNSHKNIEYRGLILRNEI